MNVTFFSTQQFEPFIFDQVNQEHRHVINYQRYHLSDETIAAVPKTEVACCFVNDKINRFVIDGLKGGLDANPRNFRIVENTD